MIRILDWMRKVFPWWMRVYHRLEIRGITNLPKSGSAVIAPNHAGSFDLDNLCIMSALEHFKTNNPARKRIWECYWDKWSVEEPMWAPWVQKFSPIPINLQGKGIPYPLVDKLVQRGELLAIMPEGTSATIQEGYRVWKFYPGVIRLHLRYRIPIIPTACIGFVTAAPMCGHVYDASKVPPWENEIICPMIFPQKCIIHFGPPISFPEFYHKEPDKATYYALAREVRKKVKEMINNYYPHASTEHPYGQKTKK